MEALAWLLGFADMERGVGWNPRASPDEQWKLGRTRALLDLAGAPDRSLACILIAGTKGKGSTAAMLASILSAASIPVGLYSKPHLQTYYERIRVDGQAIDPETFAGAVARLRRVVDTLRRSHPEAGEPTTFELTTTLALDHFARTGCRVAVVEVGLGGRLDATNAVEPVASVIAPISRDHTAILGNTLAAIAREKAGILRRDRPALLARQRPAAAAALARACRATGARCRVVPPLVAAGGGRALVPASSGGDSPVSVRLSLVGDHQRQNAALAVAAARACRPVPDGAVRRGLEQLRWPGRFEVVSGTPPVVLDGAHNDASAAALAATLRDYAGDRPVHLVVGINRDKEVAAFLRPLLRLAATVRATRAVGLARGYAPDELARLCRRLAPVPVEAIPDVAGALGAARADAQGVVCVTGSLALVGQARDALGIPPPNRLW